MSAGLSVWLREPLTEAGYVRVGDRLRTLARQVGFSQEASGETIVSWTLIDFYLPVDGVEAGADIASVYVDVELEDGKSGLELLESYPEAQRPHLRAMGLLDDREQFEEALGFFPAQRLRCAALGKDRVPAALVGHVALHLAELLDGYIGLDGDPELPPIRPERVDFEPEGSKLFSFRRPPGTPLRPSGPGRVFEVYHTYALQRGVIEIVDGKEWNRLARWYRTIMDAEYFRHWFHEGGLDAWSSPRRR